MRITPRLMSAAAALALAACQTVPPVNNDLVAARDSVERARSDVYVARQGALELDRAQKALRVAEDAWAKDKDVEQTRHLAYLAKQRAETALAVGAQAQAEDKLQQASVERDRIRLEARTREAELATRKAQAAQSNAQMAQASALAARSEAEMARDKAQQESERARQESERAASLERDLQSLQAQSTQRGLVVTLGDVLFATGSATLYPAAQRSVNRLNEVLKQYPERRVLIEGFTDNVGADATNEELSRRRAEAFRQALLERGVASDRIEVRAYGEAYPVADNNTSAGRQQNRRVEVLFSNMQGRFSER